MLIRRINMKIKKKNHLKIDEKKMKKFYQISQDDFENKMKEELNPIFAVLKSKKLDKKLERHLKNYLIIRVVTIAENYFGNKARDIIDKYDVNVTNLVTVSSIKDLDSLIENTHRTKGEIIASNFSFQNELQIDYVFTQLLGFRFFEAVENMMSIFSIMPELENVMVFNWDKLYDIFELRHKIIHNLWTVVDYNSKDLVKLCITAIMFLGVCETIVEYELHATPDKKISEMLKRNPWTMDNPHRSKRASFEI